MSASLWLRDLAVYSLQAALVAGAGLCLPPLMRLRMPRVLYAYWQVLLAACLLLPFIQPWRHGEESRSSAAAARILFVPDAAPTRLAALPAARMVLLVVGAGIVLRLAWLALGLARLRRFRDSARKVGRLPLGIQAIATRLGVAPEFRLSEEVPGPVTFGFRRPVILLPPRFGQMDAGRQQAIVSHELFHVVRRDWAANLIEELVLAAFWFHPVF